MEHRLFDPENPPEWLDPEWWVDQPHVNHLDNWVHEARLEAAADASMDCAQALGTYTVCDLGSCDGGLLELLEEPWKTYSFGYDVIKNSIAYGKAIRGVDLRWGNVVKDKSLELAPVVVCTEMLEHLEDPHEFLRDLRTRDVVYGVFSSPHSETPEHHEWNHAWCWDRQGYAEMIEDAGWTIVRHQDVEWSQQIVAKV